ncbi:DNA alkylation repair protein [Streptococcus oralis subsp. dentisani]|uniref:DNA alkylation repair protein n=1 Tax=Streptococcus oralis subsp. dentisani TaxID=1458253 RepID=A0A2I1UGQ8_STROR|nr:DNA alkylation repair protein [Streptococcus oralis subsp. dentisani]
MWDVRRILLILFENLFKPRQLCLAVLKYSLRLAS